MTTPVAYFDNAATSWPKPAAVREAVAAAFGDIGGNPGRSGHRMSIAASRVVEDARELVARLINAPDPSRVVFTKNATEALNIAIYGTLRPGDHAVTTSVEHNAVMRPLRDLESRGVELTVIGCAPDGTLDADAVERSLRPDTRLIVTAHGTNVVGSLLPIERLAVMARERGIAYLVDAAQTIGSIPVDVTGLGIDFLAFTGHKSMLGPTGTGGLHIREGLSPSPLLRGGTGSRSDEEHQPDFLPDRYEGGTLNVAGLSGLAAGVRHVLATGVESIATHERELVTRFVRGAASIRGVTVYGPDDPDLRCGVVSFNITGLACSDVGQLLDDEFSILCRTGLHCAPSAHRTVGTFPTGSVRFGFGPANTVEEIDRSLAALERIAAWAGGRRG